MKRIENICLASVFAAIIFGISIFHIFAADKNLSYSERRKLETFPDITVENILSGKFMNSFENYALDQFPLRDDFRRVKAVTHYYAFRQKDNNGIYLADGSIGKLEYPLSESSVIGAAEKLMKISELYLDGSRIFLSIIPDKNYFLAKQNFYPSVDYEKLRQIMRDNTDMEYIDIFDTLDISDYYKTDTHWRQDRIIDTAKKIADALGVKDEISFEFENNFIDDFYGVYYGQSALPINPDRICYLTNTATQNSVVYNIERAGTTSVYDLEKLSDGKSMDKYDIFLSGAAALLTIENKGNESGRELIIFRDSFGSSLTPLLLEAYSKIILIDTRYIATDYLKNYVDFSGQDVLFIYSTLVLNNSSMLK